jgi:tripartite-type tricarboxylate transporter receptor subunit TctC
MDAGREVLGRAHRLKHEELANALRVPTVAESLREQGMAIVGAGPEHFGRFVQAEIDRWAKVVRADNIRAGD